MHSNALSNMASRGPIGPHTCHRALYAPISVQLLVCRVHAHTPQQHNGSDSSSRSPHDALEDPVEAMMRVARQELGMDIAWSDPEEDEEEYLDAMEELEDVWMRNPSSPEWAEVTGLVPDTATSSSSEGRQSSSTAQQPNRGIATISWPELQQQVQDSQQQAVVVIEVVVAAGDLQQPPRSLPDPLPWTSSSTSSSALQLQHERLALQEITRDVAAAWQDKAVIAVLDTGHHSCLAAAIRLSAVYRLSQVVLLQL